MNKNKKINPLTYRTILNEALVLTFDNSIAIVVKGARETYDNDGFGRFKIYNPLYIDLISGVYYEKTNNRDYPVNTIRINHILSEEPIFQYLTPEQLKKLADKTFDNKDLLELYKAILIKKQGEITITNKRRTLTNKRRRPTRYRYIECCLLADQPCKNSSSSSYFDDYEGYDEYLGLSRKERRLQKKEYQKYLKSVGKERRKEIELKEKEEMLASMY